MEANRAFSLIRFPSTEAKELEDSRSPHVRQALAAPLHGTSLTAEARFDSSAPAMARARPEGVLQEDRLPQTEQSRLQDLSRVGEASRSGHFRVESFDVGFSGAPSTCVPSKVKRGKMWRSEVIALPCRKKQSNLELNLRTSPSMDCGIQAGRRCGKSCSRASPSTSNGRLFRCTWRFSLYTSRSQKGPVKLKVCRYVVWVIGLEASKGYLSEVWRMIDIW